MGTYALFINGVYRGVLEEILTEMAKKPERSFLVEILSVLIKERERTYFLQVFGGTPIVELRQDPPSMTLPLPLYMSTTDDLKSVSYKAQIVGWEDKRQLSEARRREVTDALDLYQQKERGLYNLADDEGQRVNLISIRGLERIAEPFSIDKLIEKSGGKPLFHQPQLTWALFLCLATRKCLGVRSP